MLATAALVAAGGFSLAGCYTEESYQLPTRAMKELSPEMLTLLQQKNMPKDSPILVRLFKEESELEVWKEDTTGQYQLLKVYPICRWSGELGPKKTEGDRQAPEGFYSITPGLMNPNSNYYLAINMGFPNAYDRSNGYSGAFLMIHGDCSSRGCYAMTDEQIGEIYSLAREAFLGGEKQFQIQAYPFRMTPKNLARHRNNPNMAFWKMLKEGNDHFEVSHLEPKVDVCERHYVFDAVPPGESTKPLTFSPSGRCPAYDIAPAIAEAALEKQRNDDYQIAQLVKDNVPTAPIVMGTDGGMNRVFASKLAETQPVMDNDGHLHAPPIHPGMPAPTLSGPREDPLAGVTPTKMAESSTNTASSSVFGNVFNAKSSGTSAQVAVNGTTDADSHSGFFGNLFKPKPAPAPAPQAPGTMLAGLNPKADIRRSEAPKESPKPAEASPQMAQTPAAKPKQPDRSEQANAAPAPRAPAAAPASAPAPIPVSGRSTLMSGAQPVMPSGSFEGRWAGVQ